jgi:hypothetical protein
MLWDNSHDIYLNLNISILIRLTYSKGIRHIYKYPIGIYNISGKYRVYCDLYVTYLY